MGWLKRGVGRPSDKVLGEFQTPLTGNNILIKTRTTKYPFQREGANTTKLVEGMKGDATD
jgi:hypothetical protein